MSKVVLDAAFLQEKLDGYKTGINDNFIEAMGTIARIVSSSDDQNSISEQVIEAGKSVESVYNTFVDPARKASDAVGQYIDLANYHEKSAQLTGVTARDTSFETKQVDVSKATRVRAN